MRKLFLWMCLSVSVAAFGCGDQNSSSSSNSSSSNNGTSTGTASQGEVNRCKEACNQQKFFDCYDAAAHANCFQDCDQSDSSDIDLFASCVEVDICDPECATHIEPPEPPPAPSSSDCETACEGIVADQCIPATDCSGACAQATEDEKSFFVYCEANRNGCEFPEACEFEGSAATPQDECKSGCDTMGTFDCIASTDVAECRSICDGLDDSAAEGFAACVRAEGICSDDSCYAQINEGGGSADVSGCQAACDDMAFFDCLDAAGQSDCRSTCESAEDSAIETFKSCVENGICDDSSCYDVFAGN